ncbi:FAD-dependent monooxygenase, partial [Undibacterium luofuense]|uniref:FAD-dependent monooxygenase n=1 Tax=Undibacterium luofuense TaxID=2828733 RepID=UPI0030EEFBB1
MKILINGGGPAGLFGALLLKKRRPDWEVHVTERHAAEDTFGWGVVLSEDALEAITLQDADLADALSPLLHHWNTIEIRRKGELVRSTGHDFYAISRYQLLKQMQDQCKSAGVIFHWQQSVADPVQQALSMRADLLIGADGLYSAVRQQLDAHFQPKQTQGKTRFVWLGTTLPLDTFLFSFIETEHGWMQAHAYKHDRDNGNDAVCSTWIVEMPEAVWKKGGWEGLQTTDALSRLELLFADDLQGHKLYALAHQQRGSVQWMQFPQLYCQRWYTESEAGDIMGDPSAAFRYYNPDELTRTADQGYGDVYNAARGYQMGLGDSASRIDARLGGAAQGIRNDLYGVADEYGRGVRGAVD